METYDVYEIYYHGKMSEYNDVLNGIFIGYIEMTDSWKPSKERTILDENDLEIFIYVFKQIFNAIEKLEARKKLVHANEKLKAERK